MFTSWLLELAMGPMGHPAVKKNCGDDVQKATVYSSWIFQLCQTTINFLRSESMRNDHPILFVCWSLRIRTFLSSSIYSRLVGGLVAINLAFSHIIGNNHLNWRSYFSEGFKPPTRCLRTNVLSKLPNSAEIFSEMPWCCFWVSSWESTTWPPQVLSWFTNPMNTVVKICFKHHKPYNTLELCNL